MALATRSGDTAGNQPFVRIPEIVTEWHGFRSSDFDTIKGVLKTPVIFDGRNLYDPKLVREMGFECLAIGR